MPNVRPRVSCSPPQSEILNGGLARMKSALRSGCRSSWKRVAPPWSQISLDPADSEVHLGESPGGVVQLLAKNRRCRCADLREPRRSSRTGRTFRRSHSTGRRPCLCKARSSPQGAGQQGEACRTRHLPCPHWRQTARGSTRTPCRAGPFRVARRNRARSPAIRSTSSPRRRTIELDGHEYLGQHTTQARVLDFDERP